ncbi:MULTISPECIES: hypothetical protein [Kitasatospora]|uniref:Uncharacterized protein n=1 Tax=Kitasatospora cathayae TaxID=3004092 RepID=A0ABY7QF90_9ACTN|nr:hypothetical protein [Kitasatospora sp. HUAS 3-15]WBP91211.1 hypothetical protein O1G21_38595 [Kitasatospora sp. HUAS 3-15]
MVTETRPRSSRAGGTAAGRPAQEYASFDGVGTEERAQQLFDAVAHLIDARGCPACPTAHLCTRDLETEPTV